MWKYRDDLPIYWETWLCGKFCGHFGAVNGSSRLWMICGCGIWFCKSTPGCWFSWFGSGFWFDMLGWFSIPFGMGTGGGLVVTVDDGHSDPSSLESEHWGIPSQTL